MAVGIVVREGASFIRSQAFVLHTKLEAVDIDYTDYNKALLVT